MRIAIDDYGSGLSSLAYLKQLPAHELKIDKMFVQSITNSQRDALLVRSTIDLAHGLGMDVTAEGVETPAAFALLAAMSCDLAQGYLVSRPAARSTSCIALARRRAAHALLSADRRRRRSARAGAGDAAEDGLASSSGSSVVSFRCSSTIELSMCAMAAQRSSFDCTIS